MPCPKCGSDTRTLETRRLVVGDTITIARRRECAKGHRHMTSEEVAVHPDSYKTGPRRRSAAPIIPATAANWCGMIV